MVTKIKKNQIMTKPKNSNWEKTQSEEKNSKTQNVLNLKW